MFSFAEPRRLMRSMKVVVDPNCRAQVRTSQWTGDSCGSLCRCDGEFVTCAPESLTARRRGDLSHDVAEHLVAGRERDLALDLDSRTAAVPASWEWTMTSSSSRRSLARCSSI
jgi:hypothetical protein